MGLQFVVGYLVCLFFSHLSHALLHIYHETCATIYLSIFRLILLFKAFHFYNSLKTIILCMSYVEFLDHVILMPTLYQVHVIHT